MARILVVDDEPGMLEVCEDTLAALEDAQVETQADPAAAAERIRESAWDLILLDIRMPGTDGVELLRLVRATQPDTPVIMLTAFPTVETAVASMKLGAIDYLTKPFIPDELLRRARRALQEERLKEENRRLYRQIEGAARFDELIGASEPMQRLFESIRRVAPSESDVLIVGESGTGKELVARSLHTRSGRKGRFVPVDCGAIPENLFESEVFGYERGAFTGADKRSPGLLELAEKGTLLLDEVGELPLAMQAKLLRTLQERKFRRVGGREEIRVDVRVVSATNRNLSEAVRAGTFREDLYYRLNVVPLRVPPLRERPGDVPLLFHHFLQRYGGDPKHPPQADPTLLRVLARHAWPGNVRELQSLVRRMLALGAGDLLTTDDLPDDPEFDLSEDGDEAVEAAGKSSSFFHLKAQRLDEFERDYLENSLRKHSGSVTAAAAEAGMPRGTYYRLLKKHAVVPERFRTG